MTNIEKVKRILDAGHYVKVTFEDGVIRTVTSYYECLFSYFRTDIETMSTIRDDFKDCTIEVIQRIPTPYVAGDKVLVLSNPYPGIEYKEVMVWKVCEINSFHNGYYRVWTDDKSDWFYFPSHCLSPVFEEDSLSGKEAKVTIDGKEYSVTLKLI